MPANEERHQWRLLVTGNHWHRRRLERRKDRSVQFDVLTRWASLPYIFDVRLTFTSERAHSIAVFGS